MIHHLVAFPLPLVPRSVWCWLLMVWAFEESQGATFSCHSNLDHHMLFFPRSMRLVKLSHDCRTIWCFDGSSQTVPKIPCIFDWLHCKLEYKPPKDAIMGTDKNLEEFGLKSSGQNTESRSIYLQVPLLHTCSFQIETCLPGRLLQYCAKVMQVIFDKFPGLSWLFDAISFETIFH